MKKIKFISLILASLITTKVFAATQTTAIICNKSTNNFHFKLMDKYQADVLDEGSYEFDLKTGGCNNINFYYQDDGFGKHVDQDFLFFQDQTNVNNSFQIKPWRSPTDNYPTEADIDLYYFNMPGFTVSNYQWGEYYYNEQDQYKNKYMHFDIVDAASHPSSISSSNEHLQSNTNNKRSASSAITQTAVKFW
ncbi:MAG: hypothetical protein EKK54_08165 [Neisseriaceae bacterium]|nr:MAG: hypothetical protein EKK54_08165 [Neisseriaceae bacterium]